MNRTKSFCFFSALVSLIAACGKVVVDPSDHDGVNGESSSTSGSGGSGGAVTATTGGAGGEPTDGGGMCNLPPPPSPTVPEQPGCYINVMMSGWVLVPCLCNLWLANTTQAPTAVSIQLTVTPPEQVPTLTGALDVGIAFDDPDASWYAIWTKQGGNGVVFTVMNEGGTTTVRMGEGSVALAPVPLAACKTGKAIAHVFGSDSASLSMQAVLANEIASATAEGTCLPPPLP